MRIRLYGVSLCYPGKKKVEMQRAQAAVITGLDELILYYKRIMPNRETQNQPHL